MQEEIDSCTQAKVTTVQAKLSKKNKKIGKTVKLSCCKRALASTRISVSMFRIGASHVFLSQSFQFRKIIIEGNVFFPNKTLTCFENKVIIKRSIECKQLELSKKRNAETAIYQWNFYVQH